MAGGEMAAFLAGSPERQQALEALAADPASPAVLADELSLSRRSVQRHLAAFEDRNWVAKDDGEYALTTTGTLVAAEHDAYLETMARIDEFEPLYTHLAASEADLAPDPRWLSDATLTTATNDNPQAPVTHYLDRVRSLDTDHVKMLSPVLSRLYHDAHAELALDGVHTELVLPGSAVERARAENPVEFAAIVTVGVLDLYRHPDAVPFGLTIGEDCVLILGYDEDGQLQACLEAPTDQMHEWATRIFATYRDDGVHVDSPIEASSEPQH